MLAQFQIIWGLILDAGLCGIRAYVNRYNKYMYICGVNSTGRQGRRGVLGRTRAAVDIRISNDLACVAHIPNRSSNFHFRVSPFLLSILDPRFSTSFPRSSHYQLAMPKPPPARGLGLPALAPYCAWPVYCPRSTSLLPVPQPRLLIPYARLPRTKGGYSAHSTFSLFVRLFRVICPIKI